MRTAPYWICLLPLLLLILCSIELNEARGGRRGGGGGMFGAWRKIKKPSGSSSYSARRTQGQKFDVPYTPLKSKLHQSTKTRLPPAVGQHLPAGATYHANGAPLPAGASYHGVAVPAGGSYYANAASMPAGAIYYAQAPSPLQPEFSATNFLMAMYAGQMLGNGLFGHHPYVRHVYHDSERQLQQQQAVPSSDKVVIIENGAPSVQVPLAPFGATTAATTKEARFGESENVARTATGTATATSGIICVPLLINKTVVNNTGTDTDTGDNSGDQHIPKIICYPAAQEDNAAAAKLTPANDAAGIICVPQQIVEPDPNNATNIITVQKQICYPAPPTPTEAPLNSIATTDYSVVVVGNIFNERAERDDLLRPSSPTLSSLQQQQQQTQRKN